MKKLVEVKDFIKRNYLKRLRITFMAVLSGITLGLLLACASAPKLDLTTIEKPVQITKIYFNLSVQNETFFKVWGDNGQFTGVHQRVLTEYLSVKYLDYIASTVYRQTGVTLDIERFASEFFNCPFSCYNTDSIGYLRVMSWNSPEQDEVKAAIGFGIFGAELYPSRVYIVKHNNETGKDHVAEVKLLN